MRNRIAAMICLVLPCAVARAESAAKTFPASGLTTLDIRSAGGDLKIAASDAQDVKVVIVKLDPEKCEITTERSGNVLYLEARNKKKWLWPWNFGESGCKAGFDVQAPKSLSLTAAAGSGDVRVAERSGDLDIKAGSGDIRLYDVTGDVRAKLGSGALKGITRSKHAEVLSGSGSINLSDLIGSAQAASGSGGITLEWAAVATPADVDVKTGSGDVSLLFPAGTKLQTDIRAGSGSVLNEFGDSPTAALHVSVKTGIGDVKIGKRAR